MMKKMFNFIVIALVLFVWNANAQECSKTKVEKLAKELSLTTEQKQKVEALYQQCSLNDKDAKATFQTEIKTILSAEQYTEYEKIYGKQVGKKSCCAKKEAQGEGKSCGKDKKSCCSKKEGKSCSKDKKSCSTSEAKSKKSCCSSKKA